VAELDNNNEIFKLAVDLVNQSNRNIFLTGKAGTGKTTFLRYIREHSLKQTAVVAPTGVAAINAGGSTIHSFFQLPFSPFMPEVKGMQPGNVNNKHTLFGKIKLNSERIKVIRQLELLIIDEISMVRCDLLDSIDAVLRHFRNRHSEPFGGVQVLLIGDMHQLPPVTVDHEWNLLSQFYESPYFFSSRIIQQAPPVYVAFEKIYRQQDDRFIDLLNQVRNNNLSAQGKQLLESLFHPGFRTHKEDGYITLTTHNYKADAINAEELSGLKAKLYSFKATIEGDFNEKAYPADEMLQLKEGAQVMFIKNDKEKIKRYYNGRIGVITRITNDGIYVQCKDDIDEIEVQKETWENIRYTVNKSTNRLEEDVIGSFTQYPLRLAWAVTIHKSQGLTFEKAVIDAGEAFAAGQVYVALSRCTTLGGIVLQSRITASSLRTDETIARFSRNMIATDYLKEELARSKKIYQQGILLSIFDLLPVLRSCKDLQKLLQDNNKDFNEASLQWIGQVEEKLVSLLAVAGKFKEHLNRFFTGPRLPEEDELLQNRVKDASGYFTNGMGEVLQLVSASPAVTDSKLQAKNFNEAAKELFISLAEKKYLLQGLSEGFSVEAYYRRKKSFVVPSLTMNAYVTASSEEKKEIIHPALHYQLRELRNKICEQKSVAVFMVASTKSIDEMVRYLPQTPEELMKISGFGKAKVEQYGEKFLALITAYSEENNLSSLIHEKNPKRERKAKDESLSADTKTLTYELYKEGKSVEQIAAERKLTTQTIEGHLSFYVSRGIIPVDELVKKEKLLLIEPHIINMQDGGLTPIKEKLGESVSFGEIRLAIAAKEWEKLKETVQEPL
jgi:uncharacterized protein YpbB